MVDILEIHGVRKGLWAFFVIADWLGRQTPTHTQTLVWFYCEGSRYDIE